MEEEEASADILTPVGVAAVRLRSCGGSRRSAVLQVRILSELSRKTEDLPPIATRFSAGHHHFYKILKVDLKSGISELNGVIIQWYE